MPNLPAQTPDVIRLATFAGVFIACAMLEALWPRHHDERTRVGRWPHNLGLIAIDTFMLRVVAPLGVVGVAIWAEARQVGLWHQIDGPSWLMFGSTILLLDLAVYLQHVLVHRVPWLWRIHRVHHADVDVDVTTGLRFHPAEMVLSLAIKCGVVAVWGGGATAVLVFEVLLNATSMFTHANLTLPARLDRLMRHVVVTPDMHRVHHSIHRDECNSNFGFNLPWWDRWFGTYRSQPRDGHEHMTLGVQEYRAPAEQHIVRLLTQPFRRPR